MKKESIKITESQLKSIVKKSVKRVLEESAAIALNYAEYDEPMTYNQKMSLNEMAQININEMGIDKKSSFNCNSYYVYVKGEGAYKKFPHFHIKHKGEGWDIRMNMDGTFNTINTKSDKRQNAQDFSDIEKIAMKWVNKPNSLEPDKTNGEVANLEWIRNNS